MSLTPITDDREPGALQRARTGSEQKHRGLSALVLSDAKLWTAVRRGSDVLSVLAGVLVVLLGTPAHAPETISAVVFALGALVLLHSRRSLRKQLSLGMLDGCVGAVASCAIGAMVATAAGDFAGAASANLTALRLWIVTAALLCLTRTVLGVIERRARARGLLMTPTLVVGTGVVGAWVVRRLEQQPSLGLRPIGFLDVDPELDLVDPELELPVLGTPDEALEVARETGARQLVFAFSWERDHQLAGVVRRCQAAGLEVSIVPRMYEAINDRASLDHVGGLPLIGFQPLSAYGWRFSVKYAIDRFFALVALIALAPLMLLITLAVHLSSPGPLIYRQRRVGRHGREFDLLKFRSMSGLERRSGFSPAAGAAPGGIEGADRRTRVGRWLRNSSLDELPQLVNVLRGEMSLIGPRPERPEFAAMFAEEIPGYDERHRIRPGITGWAQVNGLRGQTSIADRVEWDNHYIENWSIRLELRILALTTAAVLSFREAPQQPDSEVSQPSLNGSDSPELAPAPDRGPAAPLSPSPASHTPPTRTHEPLGTPAPAMGTKPTLRLIEGTYAEAQDTHWFCGYCGIAAAGGIPTPVSRVCEDCQAGLLLEAPADTAPDPAEAFLVVDARLTVQAVSKHAEQVLGVREQDVTDQPITELLTDADVELDHPESFATALAGAAMSDEDRSSTFVRPRDQFGIRIRARISHCGPPRAALIVLETPGPEAPPRLRLVRAQQPRAQQAGH